MDYLKIKKERGYEDGSLHWKSKESNWLVSTFVK